MVSVVAFNSDDSSLNPSEAYNFSVICIEFEKKENKQKEAGVIPLFKDSDRKHSCWGKYHCTTGLQFYQFEYDCFNTNNIFIFFVGHTQSSYTGDQLYSSPSSISECTSLISASDLY